MFNDDEYGTDFDNDYDLGYEDETDYSNIDDYEAESIEQSKQFVNQTINENQTIQLINNKSQIQAMLDNAQTDIRSVDALMADPHYPEIYENVANRGMDLEQAIAESRINNWGKKRELDSYDLYRQLNPRGVTRAEFNDWSSEQR